MESCLVACTDTDGLMQTIDINHNPVEWRLCTDSSKLCLKAVLLHNGNTPPSFPVGHSVYKCGLMKNVVKVKNQEKAVFSYLREKFPRLSEAKLKEGIFIGPQLREHIKDEFFDKLLQGNEKAAWHCFKFEVKGFLGNRRAQNYEKRVNTFNRTTRLGCNMALKYTSFTRIWIFSQRTVVQ